MHENWFLDLCWCLFCDWTHEADLAHERDQGKNCGCSIFLVDVLLVFTVPSIHLTLTLQLPLKSWLKWLWDHYLLISEKRMESPTLTCEHQHLPCYFLRTMKMTCEIQTNSTTFSSNVLEVPTKVIIPVALCILCSAQGPRPCWHDTSPPKKHGANWTKCLPYMYT